MGPFKLFLLICVVATAVYTAPTFKNNSPKGICSGYISRNQKSLDKIFCIICKGPDPSCFGTTTTTEPTSTTTTTTTAPTTTGSTTTTADDGA